MMSVNYNFFTLIILILIIFTLFDKKGLHKVIRAWAYSVALRVYSSNMGNLVMVE
jgi:hypothetical protein